MFKRSDTRRYEKYTKVFKSEDGKDVLKDILSQCGTFSQTFSSDPYQAAFNEGRRSVGRLILSVLNTDPEVLSKAIQQEAERVRYIDTQQQEVI